MFPQLSLLLKFLTFLFVAVSSILGAHGTVPSPKASTELICPTDRASDCYPSTFQPTEEFQIVKDDQALPPGLHVRMNLATGVKEARLNVPEPESASSDLVIIDELETEPEEMPRDLPSFRDQVVRNEDRDESEAYLSHSQAVLEGLARERTPPFEPGEASTFETGVTQLRSFSSDQNGDPTSALISLQDLCHSGDWGLKLTKDSNITRLLVQVFQNVTQELSVRSGAALLLATAIQNNPDALSVALSHFYNDEWPTGPLEAVFQALLHEYSAKFLIRTIFLLSNLCQDDKHLVRFIRDGGLDVLLDVFQTLRGGEPDSGKLQGKIANFILDHVVELDLVPPKPTAYDNGDETTTDSITKSEDDDWVIVGESPVTSSYSNTELIESSLRRWNEALENASMDLASSKTSDSITAFESMGNLQKAISQRLAQKFHS